MTQIALIGTDRCAVVDADIAPALSGIRWRARSGRNGNLYAAAGVAVSMHRMVANLVGLGAGMIDHKNGDGLDNRAENLRIADHAQNAWNSIRQVGASGVPGVHRNRNGWAVRFAHRGQTMYLGTFRSLEEAAAVAFEGRKKLRGEFVSPAEVAALMSRLNELQGRAAA